MIYEWDEGKYFSNYLKHWVRFEDAKEVWADPFSIEIDDFENPELEVRFIRIGHSYLKGILFVVFCERENGDVIRIISARRATKSVRKKYERRI
jgi:uncharacterized DUF497 family protein